MGSHDLLSLGLRVRELGELCQTAPGLERFCLTLGFTFLSGFLQTKFRLGVRFYTEEQPAAAILHLEKALEEYFVADAECRALCEGPYDYEGYNYLEYSADLFQAMTGECSAQPFAS